MPQEQGFVEEHFILIMIGCIIVAILLLLGAAYILLDPFNAFSSKTVNLKDPANDWAIYDFSATVNPDPYPISVADLRKISFAVDNENLYVTWQFEGNIPADPGDIVYDGDRLEELRFYVAVDRDNNVSTGNRKYGGAEILMTGSFPRGGDTLDTTYRVNPIGGTQDYQGTYTATITDGGPGYDYVTLVYPLDTLDIDKGQILTVNGAVIVASERYAIASMDRLDNLDELGPGSYGGYFRFKLGEGLMPMSSYNDSITLFK